MAHSDTPAHLGPALTALTGCNACLVSARADAVDAAAHLTGARHDRAVELADKLVDCLVHVRRLVMVTTGDLHRCRSAAGIGGDRDGGDGSGPRTFAGTCRTFPL